MLRPLSLLTAGAVGCVVALGVGVAPAAADSQVTVRGVGFPEGKLAQLAMVGCTSIYDRTIETLNPFIGRGPGQAPLGSRSLGYDLEGGNAIGSVHYVLSMRDTTTAELAVYAEDGAAGVAYAGYQEPDESGTAAVWIGRAAVHAPAGTWSQVQAPELTYTWTKYDMVTQQVIPTGTRSRVSTVRQIVATAGDGAGFYSIGFGCDGARFSMDAWRVGSPGDVTSYDLEGLTTMTAIDSSAQQIQAGEKVTLTGRVRLGMGDRLARATLMLESKPVGRGEFEVVAVMDAADVDPSAVVRPTESTVYRWRFADRPLAEGSESSPLVITVRPDRDETEQPEPPGPTGSPSDSPPPEEPTKPPSDGQKPPPSQPPPAQPPPAQPPPAEPPPAEPPPSVEPLQSTEPSSTEAVPTNPDASPSP